LYNSILLQQCSEPRELSSAGSEHLPYKQRVTGSNPVAPTNRGKQIPRKPVNDSFTGFFVLIAFQITPKRAKVLATYPTINYKSGQKQPYLPRIAGEKAFLHQGELLRSGHLIFGKTNSARLIQRLINITKKLDLNKHITVR
jgi:hypothetical protein